MKRVCAFLCMLLLIGRAATQVTSSKQTFLMPSGTPSGNYVGTVDTSNCYTQPLPCQVSPCSTYLRSDFQFSQNSSSWQLWTTSTLNVSRIATYIMTFTCYTRFSNSAFTMTVNVTVIDTRVRGPEFSANYANLTIEEDAPLGSLYPIVSVTGYTNGLSTVYVASGNLNDAFTVSYQPPTDQNGNSVLNGTYIVSLVLSGVLQYAELSSYQLMLLALDGSSQPLMANMTVNVQVQPANLNAPVFAQSVYFAKLNETASVGQSVLTVSATDIDFGINGLLYYAINTEFNPQLAALFTVNSQSGLVQLAGSLLSTVVPNAFEIVITAQDLAPVHPLSASCLVFVTVVRVSATRPVLSAVQWLVATSGSTAQIAVGTAAGTPLAELTIVRSDTLAAVSPITVSVSPLWLSVSQLTSTTFQLSVGSTISSTNAGTVTIVLTVASPSLAVTSVQFSLTANLIASSTVTFASNYYNVTVDESYVPGSYIVQPALKWSSSGSAMSVRFAVNSTWQLTSNGVVLASSSPFGVDATTGWLKVLTLLPCTAMQSYVVQIVLTDSSGNLLSNTSVQINTITSSVTLADSPWFSAPFYSETSSSTTLCLSDVLAYSSASCNSTLVYGAVNASTLPFTLTGTTSLCASLATVTYPVLTDWYVQATDGAARTSTALVRVTVPASTSGSFALANANLTIAIGALESAGTQIALVAAVYTGSRPSYARFSYSISSRTDPQLFSLDANNGWLSVGNVPGSFLSSSAYPARFSLLLSASDSLNTASQSSTAVTVVVHNESVTDGTNWQRLFSQRLFVFAVHNDAATQQIVGTVTVSNAAFITVQSNTYISCDLQTGTLSVASSLTTAPNWLVLQLYATTSGARNDYAIVAIQVLPASGSALPPPLILSPGNSSRVSLSIRSDTPVGLPLYSALAFDTIAQTAPTYSLLSDSSGAFQLDKANGSLSLVAPLTASVTTVSLSVLVSVGIAQTSTVRSATLTMQVNVLPCNSFSPTLSAATYTLSGVTEHVIATPNTPAGWLGLIFSGAYLQSSLGSPVVHFAYSDSDTLIRNNRTQFSMVASGSNPIQSGVFDLDARTGTLYVDTTVSLAAMEETFSFTLCAVNSLPSVFSSAGLGVRSSCVFLQSTVLSDAYWPAGPALQSTSSLTATAPVFTLAVYQFFVYENVAASTAQPLKIGRVSAFAYNSTFPSFSLSNYTSLFTVDSVGNFYATAALNRESSAFYTITVTAVAGSTSSALVNVTVLDVNEFAPQFTSASTVNVLADAPIGTSLVQISATDADAGINALVRYSLVASSSSVKFSIHPYSGLVRTIAQLTEPSSASYNVSLSIVASDSAFSPLTSTQQLTVVVWPSAQANQSFATVSNANIQTLGPYYISYNVSEGSFGTAFPTVCPVVSIALYAPNSGFTYVIASDTSRSFYVDPLSGVLTLLATPVAAVTSRYLVLVQAQSRNYVTFPRVFLNCYVQINVLASSNPPEFDVAGYAPFMAGAASSAPKPLGVMGVNWTVAAIGQSSPSKSLSVGTPTFTVPENAPVSYVAFQAYAFSRDGLSLTYTLVETRPIAYTAYQSVSSASTQFSVDAQAGTVSLAATLDFETIVAYLVTVRCTDSLGRFATASFVVQVGNVADMQPSFVTVSSGISSSNWVLTVNYALAYASFVRVPLAYVVATNPEYTALVYSLSSCTGFNESTCPVQIDSGSGLLSLWPAIFPSGGITSLNLTVAVSSYAPSSYTVVTQTVWIVFSNANDARLRAQFASSSYSLSLSNTSNSVSLAASAPVQNSVALNYAIPLTLSSAFTSLNSAILPYTALDSLSGTLTVSAAASSFISGNFSLPVVVVRSNSLNVSSGSSQQLATIDDATLVQVTVGGTSPQAPTFTYTSYEFEVPEMMGYVPNLLTIAAAVQTGPVGSLFYELFGLQAGVNSNSQAPSLYLYADLLNGTLSCTRLNYQVASQLNYSLVAFNGYVQQSSVSSQTSSLQSVLPSSTVNVTITVLDRNDCAPMFIVPGVSTWQYSWTYSLTVPSNAAVGSALMQVAAHDNDTGLMGTVQYSLAYMNNLRFGINPNNGTLFIAEPLNRLSSSAPQLSYTLSVLAADLSPYNSLTSTATVQVTIVPVNQYAPQFVGQPYLSIAVSDSPITAGTVVQQLSVAAVDLDALVPAVNNITLTVENFTGPSIVQFDSSSGNFYFSQNVTAGTLAICRFLIRATEVSYSPQLSSITSVQLVVVPSSQVSTVASLAFGSSAYSTSVSESASIGTVLLQVSAQSSGVQSTVRYSLLGPGNITFALNPSNGTLTLRSSLSFALVSNYTLLVSAQYDSDSLRQSNADAFATITISVQQSAAYPPVFLQPNYYAATLESLAGGTAVTQVRAYSPLASQNSNLSYSILVGDTQTFQFDSTNPGLLRTLIPLNYQTATNYLLVAQVSDRQSTSRTATCSVIVRVVDTNSNPPTFPASSFAVTLSESYAVGYRIGAYSASDPDLDPPLSYTLVNASLRIGSSGAVYPVASYFSVATFSSELFIINSLSPLLADPPALTRTFSLGLVASDGTFSASTSILVTINTDYTLHPPSCDTAIKSISVAQSASNSQLVTVSADAIGSSSAAFWSVSTASTSLINLANITALNQAYYTLIGSQALTYTLLDLTSSFSLSGNTLLASWSTLSAAASNMFVAIQITSAQTSASCIEYLLISTQPTGSANVLNSSATSVTVSVASPPGTVTARTVTSMSYQLFSYRAALASSTSLSYSAYLAAKSVVVNPLSGELLVSGFAPAFFSPPFASAVRLRSSAANLTLIASALSSGAVSELGNGPLAITAAGKPLELIAPAALSFFAGALPCSGGSVPPVVASTSTNAFTMVLAANQPSSFALASNGSVILNSSICCTNVSQPTAYILTQYDATWLSSVLSSYQTVSVAAPQTVSVSVAYTQTAASPAATATYPISYNYYISSAAQLGTSIAQLPVALSVSCIPFVTPTPTASGIYSYYQSPAASSLPSCVDSQSAQLSVCGILPSSGSNVSLQLAAFGPKSAKLAALGSVSIHTLPGSTRAPTFPASNYSFGLPNIQQLVAGSVIGQIGATTTEQDPVAGLVYYSFVQPTLYLTINSSTGVMQATQALVDLVNGRTTTNSTARRKRRQAAPNSLALTAQAGSLLTDANVATVPVNVQLAAASSSSQSSSNTILIIAIVVPVAAVLIIVAIVLIVLWRTGKLRMAKKQPNDNVDYTSTAHPTENGATTENGQVNGGFYMNSGGFDQVVRSNLDQSGSHVDAVEPGKAPSVHSSGPITAARAAALAQQADAVSRTTSASRGGPGTSRVQNVDGLSRASNPAGRVGSPPSTSVASSQPVSLPRVLPVFLAAQHSKPKNASQPDSGILEAFASGSASSSQQLAAHRGGSESSSQRLVAPFENASRLDDADEDDAVLARTDLNDLSRSRDCYEYLQKLGIPAGLSAYSNTPPVATGISGSRHDDIPRPIVNKSGAASRTGSHESASGTTSENNSDRDALRRAGHELLTGAGPGGAIFKDSEIQLAPTPVPFLFEPDLLANLNLAAPNSSSAHNRGLQNGLHPSRLAAGSRQNDNLSDASSHRHVSASQQSDTANRLITSSSPVALSSRPDASRTDSLMTSPAGLDAQSMIGFPDVGWTPSYQDLATVFNEIAKLPSDSGRPLPASGVNYAAGLPFTDGQVFNGSNGREQSRTSPLAQQQNGQPAAAMAQAPRIYSGSSTRSGSNSVSSARTGASSGMQIPLRNLTTLSTSHQHVLLTNMNLNANPAANRVEDTLEEMEI